MIVISLTSCIGANGNGGNVRGASVIAWVAAAACGGGPPGLAPDTAPAPPLVAHPDRHLDGAPLGWTPGSAVHLFVAGRALTQPIYATRIRRRAARPRAGRQGPGRAGSGLRPARHPPARRRSHAHRSRDARLLRPPYPVPGRGVARRPRAGAAPPAGPLRPRERGGRAGL